MKRLLIALTTFTFFTMVLGGWVRNADAGLSCPDWPLCHGKLIPPLDYQIMLEYFHRLAVFLVSLTLLLITAMAIRSREIRQQYGKNLLLAWFLLLVQIVLGGLTVLRLLQGEVVAMHLSTALAFFAVLLLTTLKAFRGGAVLRAQVKHPLLPFVRLALLVVACQLVLGGIVSSHYARWGCPDFPTCQGSWLPQMTGLAGIHYSHRLGAYLSTLLVGVFLWRFLRSRVPGLALWPAYSICGLFAFQWGLGLTLIFTSIKAASVMHLATAILIFALLLIVHDQIQSQRLS